MDRPTQDWTPVTIRQKNLAAAGASKVLAERRSTEGAHLAKLDREEFVKPKVLSAESRKALIDARLALKKTQSELDTICSFPRNTLREIEAGRMTPTGPLLNTLNRQLKLSLRLE